MPPSLISNLRLFNRIIVENDDNKVMDLIKYDFLAPPVLLPLLQYMEIHNITQCKANQKTAPYLEKVLSMKKCTDTTIPLRRLKNFEYNDYLNVSDQIESYLSDLTDEIITLIPLKLDLNSINLLLYELLTNIYKHSKFNNAYILCQWYPKINTVDVCIIDDGISIPGSLEESKSYFDDDSEAIFNALNGVSSDKEKSELHGRGLNTSATLTSLGFGEEMLISSRNGVCTINKKGAKLWKKNMPYIDGTFISLRINTNKIKNIYDYTKKRLIKKNE